MNTRESILDYPMSSEKNVQEDKIDTARINDRESIPEIDSYVITEDFLGRIDIIILKKYSRLDVLPMILDFNNLESINDLKLGDYLYLPNIDILNDNTEILQNLEEYNVPGMASHDYEPTIDDESEIIKNPITNVSINNDKKLTKRYVIFNNESSYNEQTGEIKF